MRFTLVLYPDGRGILTTEQPLKADDFHLIKTLFHQWKTKQAPDMLVLGDTEVVKMVDLELDLPEPQA